MAFLIPLNLSPLLKPKPPVEGPLSDCCKSIPAVNEHFRDFGEKEKRWAGGSQSEVRGTATAPGNLTEIQTPGPALPGSQPSGGAQPTAVWSACPPEASGILLGWRAPASAMVSGPAEVSGAVAGCAPHRLKTGDQPLGPGEGRRRFLDAPGHPPKPF